MEDFVRGPVVAFSRQWTNGELRPWTTSTLSVDHWWPFPVSGPMENFARGPMEVFVRGPLVAFSRQWTNGELRPWTNVDPPRTCLLMDQGNLWRSLSLNQWRSLSVGR